MKSQYKGVLKERLSSYRIYEPRLLPSEWVSKNIVLPSGYEAKPGYIDFNYAPYLREVLDCFENPAVRDVIFCAPTRFGKTLLLRLWFACALAKSPRSLLLFDSTIDKGRSLIRKEIKPLIQYNQVLRNLIPTNRHHFSDSHMLFPAASVDVFGANSAAGAAGDTCKMILGNEVDKWRGETDKEASMIELVRHRTESAEGERKHFFSSTPTTEDGNIWSEYMAGDQRKFFVRCPHCGHMQPLTWNQVRWSPDAQVEAGEWDLDAVRETARYACSSCGELWDDDARLTAIRDPRSDWMPTAKPRIKTTRSYQINGLYGALQSSQIGELAVDFLQARRSQWFSSRRDFWNSRMGEVFRDDAKTITVDRFKGLLDDYSRGSLPKGFKPDLIIVATDVQSYGLPFVVFGFKYSGEVKTIDHGVAPGFEDLERIQRNYTPLAGCSFVVIDIGYEQRSPEVFDAIHRRVNLGWMGIDGFEQMKDSLTRLRNRDPFLGTKNQGQFMIQVLQVSTYEFKSEWEERFLKNIDLWRTYSVPDDPEHANDRKEQSEYFEQLIDERRVPRKVRRIGKPKWEWKSRNGKNHFFDCHVYALAFFYHFMKSRSFERGQSRKKAGRKTRKIDKS